jgi:hypothetical protein
MILLGREESRFDKVSFIFDNQNEIGKHVSLWYNIFLKRATQDMKQHLGGRRPRFGDEKKLMPLQAADMFAWYQRRSVLGSLGHESHVRVWKLISRLQYTSVLDYKHLVKMADDLSAVSVYHS